MTRQRIDYAATLNPERLKEFVAAFKQYACTAQLFQLTIQRYNYWKVEDPLSGATLTTGFDCDMDRALAQLASGLKLEFVDVLQVHPERQSRSPGRSGPSSTSNSNAGGPFCVVCDVAGGLPCPNLVTAARRLDIKLAFPYTDVRIGPAHVHPGRCRKRIKQWIESTEASNTGCVLARHGEKT